MTLQRASGGFVCTGQRKEAAFEKKCFWCLGVTWEELYEPWELHAKSFPGCFYVRLRRGVEFIRSCAPDQRGVAAINIKTLPHLADMTGLMLSEPSMLPEVVWENMPPPAQPHYTMYSERIATYRFFPKFFNGQFPQDISDVVCEAGLYYTNTSDAVQCVWCDGKFSGFLARISRGELHMLWETHVQEYSCCPLIPLVKGWHFLLQVFSSLSQEQKDHAYRMIQEEAYRADANIKHVLFVDMAGGFVGGSTAINQNDPPPLPHNIGVQLVARPEAVSDDGVQVMGRAQPDPDAEPLPAPEIHIEPNLGQHVEEAIPVEDVGGRTKCSACFKREKNCVVKDDNETGCTGCRPCAIRALETDQICPFCRSHRITDYCSFILVGPVNYRQRNPRV